MKLCIFMPTTILLNKDSFLYKTKHLGTQDKRYKHYLTGFKHFIKQLVEINKITDDPIDCYVADNSGFFDTDSIISIKTEFVILLQSMNIIIITNIGNEYGQFNKGAGILENYYYCKPVLKKYDYIYHFEPRQLLMENNLIYKSIKNNQTDCIFTTSISNSYKTNFNTGLFMIKTNILFKFMVNRKQSWVLVTSR